jgi:AbrB family looped-hinge helix DNA binding protein
MVKRFTSALYLTLAGMGLRTQTDRRPSSSAQIARSGRSPGRGRETSGYDSGVYDIPEIFARRATLSSKHQITVPVWARERMKLRAGDRLRLIIEKRRLVVEPYDHPAPEMTRIDELRELLTWTGELLSRVGRLVDEIWPEDDSDGELPDR